MQTEAQATVLTADSGGQGVGNNFSITTRNKKVGGFHTG
jgi:hypothetical protein